MQAFDDQQGCATTVAILVTFALLTALMLIGVPIAISMALTALAVTYWTVGTELFTIFPQRLYSPVNSFPLLAVPFFILAGNLMNSGGMSGRVYEIAHLIVGRIRGGLGHVNVVGSMIFSGMSGSAVADAAGLGVIEINAMKRAGYSAKFSAAITAASSTIGPIIPPSIPFVVYGSLANVSVGALFLAGIVPGILMGVALMIIVAILAHRRQLPISGPRPPLAESARLVASALPALVMPVAIIGTIITGIATPTEAAAVAAIYALLVSTLIYRELKWRDIPNIVWESAKQTAQIVFIVGAAASFGWILIQQQIPNQIIESVLALSQTPWVILLLVNAVLLILGMFIEGLAIIILVYPILLPLMLKIGGSMPLT